MEEPWKKCPDFFKVYMPENSSQSLRIPLAFTLRMKGPIPDKAFLRNHCGKLWPVEVAKIGNDLFFQDGWVKFIEDNHVELGDFLVFHYDSNHVFDVKLFGRNACEKQVTGAFELKAKVEEEGEVEDEEEEEEEEEEELEAETIREKSSFGYKGNAAVKVEGGYGGAPIVEVEDADIFETGLFVRPRNPYFVKKMRRNKRSELPVPTEVIKENNLKLPPEIVLRDQNGKTWHSKVGQWKDGRTCLTGGWKAFCKWNDLRVNDRCICEFVPGMGQQRTFLQIQVVRAGSWLPK